MLERKHKGILSLNLKKLASRVDDLNITLILQNKMLLLMLSWLILNELLILLEWVSHAFGFTVFDMVTISFG